MFSRPTSVIALIIALAACGSVEPEPAATTPEPEVITETVVEEVEVEVIKEVEVIREVEVTKEVEVAPQVCIDALDAVGDLMDNAATFAAVVSEYPILVSDAMRAGMDMDVAAAERILGRIESITAEVNALGDGIEGNNFPSLANRCRATAR